MYRSYPQPPLLCSAATKARRRARGRPRHSKAASDTQPAALPTSHHTRRSPTRRPGLVEPTDNPQQARPRKHTAAVPKVGRQTDSKKPSARSQFVTVPLRCVRLQIFFKRSMGSLARPSWQFWSKSNRASGDGVTPTIEWLQISSSQIVRRKRLNSSSANVRLCH